MMKICDVFSGVLCLVYKRAGNRMKTKQHTNFAKNITRRIKNVVEYMLPVCIINYLLLTTLIDSLSLRVQLLQRVFRGATREVAQIVIMFGQVD